MLRKQDYGYCVTLGSAEIKKVKIQKWKDNNQTTFYDEPYNALKEEYSCVPSAFFLGGGYITKTKDEAVNWLIVQTAQQFAKAKKVASDTQNILLQVSAIPGMLNNAKEMFDRHVDHEDPSWFMDLLKDYDWNAVEEAELYDLLHEYSNNIGRYRKS